MVSVIKLLGRGLRGESMAEIARRTGAFGVLPGDTDAQVLEKFAAFVIDENPGFKGDKGDPGGNAMAVGLFANIHSISIPSGTDLIQTSGWDAIGVGAARYSYDATIDAGAVSANPRVCVRTSNGRGYRLCEDQPTLFHYGAVGDGIVDDIDAIDAAIADALVTQKALVVPDSVFAHSRTVNFAYSKFRVRGEGRAAFQAISDVTPCVSLDAGDTNIVYQHSIKNIIIRGTGNPDQVGLLTRNLDHGIREEIRVRNVGKYAFDIRGDVLSTWNNCYSSYADEGLDTETAPEIAFRIDRTATNTTTTSCTFNSCAAEWASSIGWHLVAAAGCIWHGGTSENLPGIGMQIDAASFSNIFNGFFMEHNTAGDLVVYGRDNQFNVCTMASGAGTSVRSALIKSGAVGNVFNGNIAYNDIEIEASAVCTVLRVVDCNSVIDNGTGTVFDSVSQRSISLTRYTGRSFGNILDPNPNVLDWYEEGDFTPYFTGTAGAGSLGAYAIAEGRFTRLGNTVNFSLTIRPGAITSPPSGNLLIGGMPYPAVNGQNQGASVGDCSFVTLPGSATQIGANVLAAATAISLTGITPGAATSAINAATLSANQTTFSISGSYHV